MLELTYSSLKSNNTIVVTNPTQAVFNYYSTIEMYREGGESSFWHHLLFHLLEERNKIHNLAEN